MTVERLAGRPIDVPLGAVLEHASDGGPPMLVIVGMEAVPLVFHSPTTGIDVGALRELGRSIPVLRLRALAIDATISFASYEDRDRAFGALTPGTDR